MSTGFLLIGFGSGYDEMAYICAESIRRISFLPIQVLTNLKQEKRCSGWSNLSEVIFTFINKDDFFNREVKTHPYKYSIFDITCYLDADIVVRSKEFLEVFRMIEYSDILIGTMSLKESQERLLRKSFREVAKDSGTSSAGFVLNPSVLVFRKNDRTENFFSLWNKLWRKRKYRDMPSLFCASQLDKGVSLGYLPDCFWKSGRLLKNYLGSGSNTNNKEVVKWGFNDSKCIWEKRRIKGAKS